MKNNIKIVTIGLLIAISFATMPIKMYAMSAERALCLTACALNHVVCKMGETRPGQCDAILAGCEAACPKE
jgi:hypothetical protein